MGHSIPPNRETPNTAATRDLNPFSDVPKQRWWENYSTLQLFQAEYLKCMNISHGICCDFNARHYTMCSTFPLRKFLAMQLEQMFYYSDRFYLDFLFLRWQCHIRPSLFFIFLLFFIVSLYSLTQYSKMKKCKLAKNRIGRVSGDTIFFYFLFFGLINTNSQYKKWKETLVTGNICFMAEKCK